MAVAAFHTKPQCLGPASKALLRPKPCLPLDFLSHLPTASLTVLCALDTYRASSHTTFAPLAPPPAPSIQDLPILCLTTTRDSSVTSVKLQVKNIAIYTKENTYIYVCVCVCVCVCIRKAQEIFTNDWGESPLVLFIIHMRISLFPLLLDPGIISIGDRAIPPSSMGPQGWPGLGDRDL